MASHSMKQRLALSRACRFQSEILAGSVGRRAEAQSAAFPGGRECHGEVRLTAGVIRRRSAVDQQDSRRFVVESETFHIRLPDCATDAGIATRHSGGAASAVRRVGRGCIDADSRTRDAGPATPNEWGGSLWSDHSVNGLRIVLGGTVAAAGGIGSGLGHGRPSPPRSVLARSQFISSTAYGLVRDHRTGPAHSEARGIVAWWQRNSKLPGTSSAVGMSGESLTATCPSSAE